MGEDGVRRAKKWLDATTRVHSSWTVYDDVPEVVERLTFKWPQGDQDYSYDLGGEMYGGGFHKQFFLAECKLYKDASDQPNHYSKFLAQSYVTLGAEPKLATHYMWITWAPFEATKWSRVRDPKRIVRALTKDATNRRRVFGDGVDEAGALAAVDDGRVEELSRRLWMIVLSERQEALVISDEDRKLVLQQRLG